MNECVVRRETMFHVSVQPLFGLDAAKTRESLLRNYRRPRHYRKNGIKMIRATMISNLPAEHEITFGNYRHIFIGMDRP